MTCPPAIPVSVVSTAPTPGPHNLAAPYLDVLTVSPACTLLCLQMEAARLLTFTEEEFARLLESAPA